MTGCTTWYNSNPFILTSEQSQIFQLKQKQCSLTSIARSKSQKWTIEQIQTYPDLVQKDSATKLHEISVSFFFLFVWRKSFRIKFCSRNYCKQFPELTLCIFPGKQKHAKKKCKYVDLLLHFMKVYQMFWGNSLQFNTGNFPLEVKKASRQAP